MPAAPLAVFLVNLVQDVNVLRPLVFMASRDFGIQSRILVSAKFSGRDLFGIWRKELDELCAQTGATLSVFEDDWEAHQHLQGHGIIFAASESHLPNHVTTHAVFLHSPPGFLRVTLQHGFECVGFRHSADHVRAHGVTASFGSDLVCSWYGPDRLLSMAPSQLPKLVVTGPTSVLQMPQGEAQRDGSEPGLVCENLHSVRLNGAGDFKGEFVAAFDEFCRLLAEDKRKVVLRPHPGGQYVLKNKVTLPVNATLNNAPMYRVDMRQFAYGISAPSSVLIDMLLAGIPTAVWTDREGEMDADNYAGLATVSTPYEWLEFARAAVDDPDPFLDRQATFLQEQGLILDPAKVYSRYAEIFQLALRMENRPAGALAPERERILYVANSRIPSLQLSFEKPLAPLVGRGEFVTDLLTEKDLRDHTSGNAWGDEDSWIKSYLDRYQPSTIVFCRYSGPGYQPILQWAKSEKVPVIYHIDDDLLAIPPDVGKRKHAFHNAPERVATVRELLTSADLVYASTKNLRARLQGYFPDRPIVSGAIYGSGSVLKKPRRNEGCKIGYMASADHYHNLEPIVPAIDRLLENNPHVTFEFFGSIPIPPALLRHGDRVSTAPPISNYESFLEMFSEYEWDVGICPLRSIDFNMMKTDVKWVEYTSVGAAVVASGGTVYDDCCANGCGILAYTVDDWSNALDLLAKDADLRLKMVRQAQQKLEQEYNVGRLRDQVQQILDQARKIASERVRNVELDSAFVA